MLPEQQKRTWTAGVQKQVSPSLPPLPFALSSRLQLQKAQLLQTLRQNRRITHTRKILRRIHPKRIRPRLRKNRHGLTRIFDLAPIHKPELQAIQTRRAD